MSKYVLKCRLTSRGERNGGIRFYAIGDLYGDEIPIKDIIAFYPIQKPDETD
jgi:hypothetical protein